MDILVAGGTGFLGRSVCAALVDRGHRVTAASRSPDGVALPEAVVRAPADVTEDDLRGLVAGHDAVVNLVALPSHVQPRASHEAVHLGGTRHLLRASEAAGVDRLVQLSGLGVEDDVETGYFRAKRAAEAAVRASGLDWVIYRPSVVFGDGCAFLPFLERLGRFGVVPLPGGGRTRLQPMWVDDLAPMVAAGVTDSRHVGATYRLGGPERLTLAAVLRLVADDPVVLPVPMPVARAGAALLDRVPGAPVGLDQYRATTLDNTVADNDVTAFDTPESSLRRLGDYLREREDGATPTAPADATDTTGTTGVTDP
ncbi:NAD(P)H-binding protein [Haloglomus halophilum]|uniref:NAD(P)H-binding protein n=1 Tax=Haloglomus halophilum TaxID=2962672 RepID=UPI0020C9ED99|nr:NAD(P)H-binding protein [Haloglomus halophilum]